MCRHLQGDISISLLLSYLFKCFCLLWGVMQMTMLIAVFNSKRLRQSSNDLEETINYRWLTQIEWAKLYEKPKGRTKHLIFWGWFPWEMFWVFWSGFVLQLWDTGENIDHRMLLLHSKYLIFHKCWTLSLISVWSHWWEKYYIISYPLFLCIVKKPRET